MDISLVLDIVVIVILLISAVVAFLRGFVRETLTIVGLVGAVLAGLAFGPTLTPGIESWFTNGLSDDETTEGMWGMIPYDIAAGAISYLGTFVITLAILSVISHFIAKSVHAIGMGPVDRSLGVVFGLLRGVVLVGLLFLPFHILMDEKEKEDYFGDSNSYSYVEYASNLMLAIIPESWNRAPDEVKEKTELLKNLTGEETIEGAASAVKGIIGTDEEAAETGAGYSDVERDAIDKLIKNQDKLKSMLEDELNGVNDTTKDKMNE